MSVTDLHVYCVGIRKEWTCGVLAVFLERCC